MRVLWVAVLLLGAALRPAAAARCFAAYVHVSSHGVVILSTGIIYAVYPGRDSLAVEFWQPLDHVQVCHVSGGIDQITDLSRKPASTVRAVRNLQ